MIRPTSSIPTWTAAVERMTPRMGHQSDHVQGALPANLVGQPGKEETSEEASGEEDTDDSCIGRDVISAQVYCGYV